MLNHVQKIILKTVIISHFINNKHLLSCHAQGKKYLDLQKVFTTINSTVFLKITEKLFVTFEMINGS